MFMQPIQIPVTVAAPRRPAALKLAVGASFGVMTLVVMPLYLVVVALWVLAGAAGRGASAAVRCLYESALYAGEAIVGR